MNRRVIGIAVVVLWVAGLLFLYRRNGTHSPTEFLVQAGLRVSPEVYYYSVQKAGTQIGVASSSVDTTKQRIVSVDFLRGALPVGNKTVKVEARSEARFTRGLRLRDFVVQVRGDLTPFTLRGVMQEGEDKTLRMTMLDGRRKPLTNESVQEKPVFISSVAPILLMLKGEPKIGDSIKVAVFDPMTRSVKPVTTFELSFANFRLDHSPAADSALMRGIAAGKLKPPAGKT